MNQGDKTKILVFLNKDISRKNKHTNIAQYLMQSDKLYP